MKKKIKLFLLILPLLFCNSSFAGLYGNIDNGVIEYKKKNYESAKNYLNQYLKNNPNDKEGFWWLGMAYSKLQDERNANLNFEKAYKLFLNEQEFEKITFSEVTGENIGDYTEMAQSFFEDGNISEADFYADMILKLDPKSSVALFIKAKVAQLNKEPDKAKNYLNKAIKYENKLLKSNLAKSLNITSAQELTSDEYYSFAQELFFRGNLENALKYLRKHISIDKSNIDAYNFLAELYYINGSYDFIREAVEEASKISDKNIKTYLIEAKINKEKSEKNLLKAYEINPNNQEVLFALANYYLEQGNYTSAGKYFSTLININDSFYEGYTGYIFCLAKKGEFDEALKLIRKLSSINEYQTETDILLAELCICQNNYKEALDYIDAALKKEKNPNYFLRKAQVNYILKKYDESLNNLKELSKLSYGVNDITSMQELYMMNYLKKSDLNNLETYITNNQGALDKNSLIYKYVLYKMYKYNNDMNSRNLQYIKIFAYKPTNLKDYFKLSEIIFEEKGQRSAIGFLNSTRSYKKNNTAELNVQKNKINFLADNH